MTILEHREVETNDLNLHMVPYQKVILTSAKKFVRRQ